MHTYTDAHKHPYQDVGPERWLGHTQGLIGGTHVCMQLCKRDGAEMRNQVDMHTCTDVYILFNHCMGPEEVCLTHAYRADRGTHVCIQLYKRVRTVMGSHMEMHTCTDTCMHSNQGIAPDKGDWDTHMEPYICLKLSKRGWIFMWCQLDIHTCGDVCTYSNQCYLSDLSHNCVLLYMTRQLRVIICNS